MRDHWGRAVFYPICFNYHLSAISYEILSGLDKAQLESQTDAILGSSKDEDLEIMVDRSVENLITGKIVKGRIIEKRNQFFVVDVGLKSEGVIPFDEFGEDLPEANEDGSYDEEEFLIEAVENRQGGMTLSKKKVARIRGWEEIVASKVEGDVVSGIVVRKIKGGLLVDVGIPVFLPASQIDIRRAPDIAEYVGTEMECKILKIDHERKNIVVSRRKLIEESRNSQKDVLPRRSVVERGSEPSSNGLTNHFDRWLSSVFFNLWHVEIINKHHIFFPGSRAVDTFLTFFHVDI